MEKKFVSITGAHGVGKTTLIHAVFSKLKGQMDMATIAEPAREIADRGFYVNEAITNDGIFEYLNFCLSKARLSQSSLVLMDRSILDLYAYTRNLMPSKFSHSLEKLIREHIKSERQRIRLYIYVPIEFPMELDDLRPAELRFQTFIDDAIKELLDDFELPYLQVSGSIDQRCEQMIQAIT